MADIKEKQRAPIKILDKTKVGAERKCGDIIFFDWKDKETGAQDGKADYTGIVEYTDLQTMKVHTIEGNTSDSVAEREYDATNVEILGYGLPMYQ